MVCAFVWKCVDLDLTTMMVFFFSCLLPSYDECYCIRDDADDISTNFIYNKSITKVLRILYDRHDDQD